MLRAALRDLQWRRKRFVIAMAGVALVFAMGLVMTGLSASFSMEVDRTLNAIGADTWAVAQEASGPFNSFNPVLAGAAGDEGAPVMVLRQTLDDDGTARDMIVMGVEPDRLGAPQPSRGRELEAAGEAIVDSGLPSTSVGEPLSFGGRTFTVVGKVSDQRLFAGIPLVYIPLADAQAIAAQGQPLATAFLFDERPSETPPGLKLMTSGEVKSDVLRPLKSARASIDFMRIMLWIVAASIIASVLYLQAMERTRDFAVFKATGTSTMAIGMGLALQAVVLSLAAALLAALLALLIAPVFPLHVEIPGSAFLLLPVVTVLVGLLASTVALRRAAAIQPAQAFAG